MKNIIPRKRLILAVHRWIGAVSALFLLILSLTGLCLNHAERLGLNDRNVRLPFILKRYNMSGPADMKSVSIDNTNTFTDLQGALYMNSRFIGNYGSLIGAFEAGQMIVIATDNGLLFLTIDGEIVEVVSLEYLPFEEISMVGQSQQGDPVIIAGSGAWLPDQDWLEFTPVEGTYSVISPERIELDSSTKAEILMHFNGTGPTLYRVLLDLHSGRLFGWGGRTIMDLTAVAIMLLVFSGITGWLRKSAWTRRPSK